MRSYILVAAVAAGQLYADGAVTWYEPADGVPLSGLESAQACESRGQRLCLYDELCPSGQDRAPVGMPSSHSAWMPFLSTTYGRRWMTGGCKVHEDLYDEGCNVPGCGTGPCANECCDHGWCTTPGYDNCPGATQGSFNGYTESCKGSYACCSEDDSCAVHGLGPEYTSGCGTGCECCRADGGCGECAGDHVCEFPYGGDYGVCTPCEERFAGDAGLIEQCHNGAGWGFDHDGTRYDNSCPGLGADCTPGFWRIECRDDGHGWLAENCASCEECSPVKDHTVATGGQYTCDPGTSPIVYYDWGVYGGMIAECNYDDCSGDTVAATCPTCDGWCSCADCAGPVNSCDWDCDESRSEPTWGGSRSDCWGDDDDGSGGGGSSMWVVGMIGGVLGVAVIVAVCVCIYCYVRYLRAKAAAAPPPMVEVQVLGTVAGAVELGPLKGAPHADPVPSAPPAAMMPPPAPPRNFCSACGAPVQGPFCGQCGARA